MAIQKEVKVVISAVDEFSSGMGMFNSQAMAMVKSVEAIATVLTGASAAAAILAGKLSKEIFNSATDFHDAMYNVEAVAQSFGTTSQEISTILDDLTQKFPITGQQAGASMQLIAQLGYGAAEELRNMSDAANILQVATGADLQTSVMGTLAILNSFNLASEEAGRVINTLAAASFSSAASIDDLGIALRYAAPIASLMGVSVEETVAALAILRDRGLEASQTGTTLRMALIQLGKETKKKTEVLKEYGLTYADVNPEVVGLTGVIEAFNGKLISGSDAATLFGTRSVAMANIINLGAQKFKSYTDSITGTTAAQDAYNKKLETWTVVQKNITGNIDLLKKAMMGDLVPAILHVIGTQPDEGIRGIINFITELEKNLGGVNQVFKDAFADIKNIVKGVFSDTVGDVQGLYEFIVRLADALKQNFILVAEWGSLWAKIVINIVNDTESVRQVLLQLNAAFMIVSATLASIHDFVVFFYNLWVKATNLLLHPIDSVTIALKKMLVSLLEFVDLSPFSDVKDEIGRLKSDIEELESGLKPKANYWMDDVADKFVEMKGVIEDIEDPAEALKEDLNYSVVMDGSIQSAEELRNKVKEAAADTRSELEKIWEQFTPEEKIKKWEDYLGEDGIKILNIENIETAEEKLKLLKEAVDRLDTSKESQGTSIRAIQSWEKEYEDRLDALQRKKVETYQALAAYASAGDMSLFDTSDMDNMDHAIIGLEEFAKRMDTSKESTRESLDALAAYEKGLSGVNDLTSKSAEKWTTDLVQVNGKWIEMKTAVKETTDELVNLNKPLDQMSDREFSLYTKQFEADLDLVKTRMKETHETVRENLKWKAQVDIAEAEASAKILTAAFESASQSVEATAKASSDMFGQLADVLGGDNWVSASTKSWMQKQVEMQMGLQKDALEIQKKLADAEVRNMDARTEKIKNLDKEAMITVKGDGLKVHLEAMMWEVFEAIQIRATEEGLDKLLLGGALSS